ncbi:MAG TPA: molybdate ABC transporter substrate-binding protein [Arsenicitalea sp.]|jgi:molybdate transport system substrate-binding protein|nr:molybdate ABC transporter substrate-binding protein [Arsenicitalea sp.]
MILASIRRGIFGRLVAAALCVALAGGVSLASAATVPVAVAANFTAVAQQLAAGFKAKTGNDLQLSFGASGALYTQITQGAPFEVFLSADTSRPKQAIADGFGVAGSSFVYAVGKLVLYSTSLDVSKGDVVLKAGAFQHIAIADPKAAPYGAAAVETLKAMGLTDAVAAKVVTGESIAQAQQFIESGNAELGFVALSQVIGKTTGSQWLVPAEFYKPIEQGAVLLKTGQGDAAAKAFLEYLKSDEAVKVIEKAGYAVGG